jgi:hypothetical protein
MPSVGDGVEQHALNLGVRSARPYRPSARTESGAGAYPPPGPRHSRVPMRAQAKPGEHGMPLDASQGEPLAHSVNAPARFDLSHEFRCRRVFG